MQSRSLCILILPEQCASVVMKHTVKQQTKECDKHTAERYSNTLFAEHRMLA